MKYVFEAQDVYGLIMDIEMLRHVLVTALKNASTIGTDDDGGIIRKTVTNLTGKNPKRYIPGKPKYNPESKVIEGIKWRG
jgi:hypothetical protein